MVAVIAGTVEPIYKAAPQLFRTFETFSVIVFSIEYLLRLWSCTSDPRFRSPVTRRVRFALTPLALVDLLAVAPYYLTPLSIDLRVLRVVRLVRIFRVAKLARYSEALRTFGSVLSAKKEELLTTLFILFLLLLLASSLIYFAENGAQSDHFSEL